MKKSEFSSELKYLPAIEAVDITNYLVVQTSFYSTKQMKAYKSMDAYNYFVADGVNDIGTKIPAAPVALIDFSSAKSKKRKMDDAIAGTSSEQAKVETQVQCLRVKRGTTETLQLPPKELAELCQDFQLEELTPSQVQL
ncbi:hypothetical protein QQF64_025920 [Cirrhinus molitorella]|uniref:Uncharacterized protein n=1 Tax=Cirrhinus molitorella TaxID=172907 RepID=A0ABR3NQU3_9TELE